MTSLCLVTGPPGSRVLLSVTPPVVYSSNLAGIWAGDDHPLNTELKIPAAVALSRQNAEAITALVAKQKTALDTELRLESPRTATAVAMTKNLNGWEDRGRIGVPNRNVLKSLASELHRRTATTVFAVSNESAGAKAAATLSVTGARKSEDDKIHYRIHPDNQLPGAKLSTMTQSIAYRGIKERNEPVSRKATDRNIELVLSAVKAAFSSPATAASIWKSIRHKDISRNIRNWLWKSMHNAHRVGKYWEHIPECGERANCVHCGAEESLQHILLECPSPGQSEVWALAEKFWKQKYSDWPEMSMGLLLGGSLASFKDERGKPLAAKSRLYRILVSESAHLIWKLRCDSVIGRAGIPPTVSEVHNRWVKIMNGRLEMDINLTNKLKYGKQHVVTPSLVLDTWKGTLHREGELPDDWLREPGVLVGIASLRSRRSPSPPVGRRGRNR
ncbi:hypothetical protein B0H16DRAFT_1349472 [Mycena metata]|uniref:Reverse transcriptase zinc-binding domain-containing protein n=1 Tax=Mycena metata TaxID=1033252 RepID=A0AAD7DTA5_9AGAR|nr:hypothetical protein B0H16DRAFT_1349472 [Mycena metata]